MGKDKDYMRLIHTRRWLELRKNKLTAQPLCERCAMSGIVKPATEVHHVYPVEDALRFIDKIKLMFDPHNLQSLCHDCHVQTHKEMGRSGRIRAKRINDERLEFFKEKFL